MHLYSQHDWHLAVKPNASELLGYHPEVLFVMSGNAPLHVDNQHLPVTALIICPRDRTHGQERILSTQA